MNPASLKRRVLSVLLCLCLCLTLLPAGAGAASTVQLKLDLEVDWSAAYTELAQLNELRQEEGLSPLMMDKELMKMAVQRAAEIAVYYSHTRPNGEDCTSLRPTGSAYAKGFMGENILWGNYDIDAARATELWYNSPGHKANMLRTEYKSIGIACVRDLAGNSFWVQNFYSNTGTPESTPSSGTVRQFFTVDTLPEHINVQLSPTSLNIQEGEKKVVYVCNGVTPIVPTIIRTSDENVTRLSMENGGVLVWAQNKGIATLTLGFAGYSATMEVQVRPLPEEIHLQEISLSSSTGQFEVEVGDTLYAMVNFIPVNAPKCDIKWELSDPSLAKLSFTNLSRTSVSIEGLKPGTATLTATTAQPVDGRYFTASVTLTVYEKGGGSTPESITLSASDLKLMPGQKLRVNAYVWPSRASQQVVWSSNDPDEVSVDQNGVITALTSGGAFVYARTPDGELSASVNVRVDTTYSGKPIFFTDVPEGSYCYDPVTWAYCQYLEPADDTGSAVKFGAANPCTRIEIVEYLWQLMGSPRPKDLEGPYFTDLPKSYSNSQNFAIQWAVEAGVTTGTGDGTTFSPDMTVTRAQAVTFLYRAMGSPSVAGLAGFSDVKAGDWYANAAVWAVKEGITNGTGGNSFTPNRDCTRGEILTFLYRQYGQI